ncbi:YpdA family putative bacillithiol disulfide reductase [Sporosarcina highlanderae]|uniref:YpdA family putative bacillithiol disulfide reductase n=1 Tax=Sporosarcina highlanderae TaxID=3035916 RepID=A0ABT8JUY5_9BACL|nr:YpdA family putative bacillithiol disulfide reductase [Sporosarcina highlanderae]MDN4608757.1 YpdA family putative bacillithiol disulfide reductase [Sporosarcina highlanderae]
MIAKDAIVIGGGPCGLSAAIEIQNKGLDVLIIEKENIVNSIYRYPTHQTFFSSSIKLSIGDIPFITAKEKPKRNDALVYYRHVAELKKLSINSFETVEEVEKQNNVFIVRTNLKTYSAKHIVIATGYYDNPNKLGIAGEDLPNVFHYFKEAHPFFGKNVVVIGGKNSAVDAAIELVRAGAKVTVIYRGCDYSPSVKPWILPGFDSLIRNGEIDMHFNSNVLGITSDTVVFEKEGKKISIENDYVFAMIGYHPDHSFLERIGIEIDIETGRPTYDDLTMETNIQGLYIAGVIAAGNNTNEIFIENGRDHGVLIANHIEANC